MTILASYTITSTSQSVDIPTGTQAVAFVWAYYNGTVGDGLASATLDSEAFDSSAELASDSTNLCGGYALWTGPNIGNGLTFAHTLDVGSPTNGPVRFLVCMGSLSTTALGDTTSIIARAGSATNASVTVDTESGDEVVVMDTAYDTVAPATGTGYTSLQSTANLNVGGRLKWISATGASLTVNSETDEYPLVVALVFQPAAAGPTITDEPDAVTAYSGQTAQFTVAATGTGTLTYQWERSTNGGTSYSNVSGGSGGTTATYTTPTLGFTENNYLYRCVVTDDNGSTNSLGARLTLIPASSISWLRA